MCSIQGRGTAVTGKAAGGIVHVGDDLEIMVFVTRRRRRARV
jgi:translation elongation factor EF-Tu-like GTPase